MKWPEERVILKGQQPGLMTYAYQRFLAAVEAADQPDMEPAWENMTPLAQAVAGPRLFREYQARQARKRRVYEGTLLEHLKDYGNRLRED